MLLLHQVTADADAQGEVKRYVGTELGKMLSRKKRKDLPASQKG